MPFSPQSLLELHKRRKALSEPEVRYYLRQIILGCQYLHSQRVIHRDLKLGNLFLSDDMEVKIGRCRGAVRPRSRPILLPGSSYAPVSLSLPKVTLAWPPKWSMMASARRPCVGPPTTSPRRCWARRGTALRWIYGPLAASCESKCLLQGCEVPLPHVLLAPVRFWCILQLWMCCIQPSAVAEPCCQLAPDLPGALSTWVRVWLQSDLLHSTATLGLFPPRILIS